MTSRRADPPPPGEASRSPGAGEVRVRARAGSGERFGGDPWPAPTLLRYASGWTVRLLVVTAGFALLFVLLRTLWVMTVALVAAFLLAALLSPLTQRLKERGTGDSLAALAGLGALLLVLSGTALFVVRRALGQLQDVRSNLAQGVEQARNWLVEGPLSIPPGKVDDLRNALVAQIFGASSGGGGGPGTGVGLGPAGLVSNAVLTLHFFAAAVLALFLLFFFLKDGERLWEWVVRLFHREVRERARTSGYEAWGAVRSYLVGVTLVALMDALGIGLALYLIGVPLVASLTLLTFLAAYVPLAGAVFAGLVATVVALATGGMTDALLTLGAVLLVQQLEGNVLQPLIVGKALDVHPVAIILAVTAGGLLAGVLGAVVAVPLLAAAHAVSLHLCPEEEGGSEPVPQREQGQPG